MAIEQPLRSELHTRRTATIGADGRGTATVSPTSAAGWRVSQVSIELAAAPTGAQATLRLNGFYVSSLFATGDAAGDPPAVRLSVGDELTVEWEGCTPGQIGRVLVFYDEVAP